MATTLGTLNPFCYRGYVYDEETGLYYLRSRYYNPEWGRFVNGDSVLGKPGQLLGHNVYAYCKNNPARFLDKDGQESIDITEHLNKEMRDAYREIGWYTLLPSVVAEFVFYQNVRSTRK